MTREVKLPYNDRCTEQQCIRFSFKNALIPRRYCYTEEGKRVFKTKCNRIIVIRTVCLDAQNY